MIKYNYTNKGGLIVMLHELVYDEENFNRYKEHYNSLIKEENLSEDLFIKDFTDVVCPIAKGIYVDNALNTLLELQFMKREFQVFENDFRETDLYGLCDNEMQVCNKYKDLLEDKNRKFIIVLSNIYRNCQPDEYGFRFHKWGKYIGDYEITCEYLKNQTNMDKVVVYCIIEVV